MKTRVDPQLTAEAARFRLRFACDDCVHFAPERAPTCGQGWPVGLRRSALEVAPTQADDDAGGRAGDFVSFCKEFELA